MDEKLLKELYPEFYTDEMPMEDNLTIVDTL
jgi:hypothetical protein